MNNITARLGNYLGRKFNLTGIKYQFVFPTLTTVFVVILSLGVTLVGLTAYNVLDSMNSKGLAVTEFLSKVSVSYIKNNDLKVLESFVNEMQKNEDVVYAVFNDPNQKVLAESVKGGIDINRFLYTSYESNIIDTENKNIGQFKIFYKNNTLFATIGLSAFLVILGIGLSLFAIGVKVFKIAVEVGDNLDGVAVQLLQSAAEMAKSSSEVTLLSQKLASSSSETDASIQSTMGSIEQISAVIDQTTRNVKSGLVKANESHDEATEGMVVVQQFEMAMTNIAETTKKLGVVQDVVDKVEQETKVIDGIVFQTKLLSFNASIEAERAGDYGKCFAVVANQVGVLAKASGVAAEEISVFLQKSKVLVADTITETGNKADYGQRISVICREVFEQIAANIKELADMVSKISNAAAEQEKGIRETSNAVRSLSEVSSQNTNLALQANELATFLDGQAESLRSNITSLEDIIGLRQNKSQEDDFESPKKFNIVS